ncbi:hypothetical protein Y032_0001g445 [Ancylostoma ceylanicum]|uniref:Seipin n=1 Tax=Ancylostoma ceylanicum TaxID=53326 RepID=A0A016W4J8_9BILA|nr:hypothetical protein Y032_0001g445 [Ancylostoma ceylanicum]
MSKTRAISQKSRPSEFGAPRLIQGPPQHRGLRCEIIKQIEAAERSRPLRNVAMLSWLVRNLRLRLERLFRRSQNVNPVYTAVLLLFQFSLAFFASLSFPLIIRRLALPPSIENEIDLNLSFNTCTSELHGICSFPSATVEYEKGTLFSPSVAYALSVRLRFADIDSGRKLGLFQNVLSFYDGDEQLKTYSKTSYLREPTILTKAMWLFFFPFYFAGFFHDYNSLEIAMTSSHIEALSHSSTKLHYQLQDRFAQVEKATLVIGARFGIIRYLLYNWPLTTSMVLFFASFSACCFTIILYWGAKSILGNSETIDRENAFAARTTECSKDVGLLSSKSPTTPIPVPPDEYIPDNVDEVPPCADFSGIPGWDVRPPDPPQTSFQYSNGNIRRRK